MFPAGNFNTFVTSGTAPPTITSQPVASVSLCADQTLTLSVAASGAAPLAYRWRIDTVDIPGATAAALSYPASSITPGVRSVDCVVSNAGGSVTSSASAVTVQPAPTSNAGSPQTTCQGVAITLNGIIGNPAPSGWTGRGTYTPAAGDTGPVTLRLTAQPLTPCSAPVFSEVVITVNPTTTITSSPASTVRCDSNPFTLTVAATGASLTYQWRLGGVNLPGETNASIPATVNGSYDCVVAGTCGSARSTAAIVSSATPVSISAPPASGEVCVGSPITLSVTASGTGLGYQWRKGGLPIGGQTGSTFSIASSGEADSGSYDVVVTGFCNTVTSSAATIVVNPTTAITSSPSSVVTCVGSSPSFTVSAVGSRKGYQYYKAQSNLLQSSSSPTFTINSVTAADAGDYYVVVTGDCGAPVTSSTFTLTVIDPSTTAYIDPAYAGLPAGTVVTYPASGGTGVHIVGCDAFASIQAGINTV